MTLFQLIEKTASLYYKHSLLSITEDTATALQVGKYFDTKIATLLIVVELVSQHCMTTLLLQLL